MSAKNRLNDEDLAKVAGGARREVHNEAQPYAYVRTGPGTDFGVVARVNNGETVYTTGRHTYRGGYDWYELVDGTYIAGSLIGY